MHYGICEMGLLFLKQQFNARVYMLMNEKLYIYIYISNYTKSHCPIDIISIT